MKKELGGERLGTGAKIKVDLHGWGRSTFNQSREWRSTMGIGMGIPCFKEIGLNGTTFDIDIKTLGHTIPTIAPLFGEFKLQVDMFACPIRLYQGLLHNNAVNIGLEMNKVLFPKIQVAPNKTGRTNTSSLLNYIGIKGVTTQRKDFNAIPILAYYDIFKNYYANKQETNAKVIGTYERTPRINLTSIQLITTTPFGRTYTQNLQYTRMEQNNGNTIRFNQQINPITPDQKIKLFAQNWNKNFVKNVGITTENIAVKAEFNKNFDIRDNNFNPETMVPMTDSYDNELIKAYLTINENGLTIDFIGEENTDYGLLQNLTIEYKNNNIEIIDFPLDNIDEARKQILMMSGKEERVWLKPDGQINFLPYSINFENDNTDMHLKEMNGLFLKTYLSDIFNNFLSNTNVELINEISSVNFTTDENGNGDFSIDTLIMAKKIYNLLNRIAVSGGTYENWQESVYGQKVITRAESPIYIGGTSATIQFQEVVSTAEAGDQPLGSLGGRGLMTNRKGGRIIYKCNEPTIIIGIASITPKIDYYQGNHWFLTEIDNMDNFHKPELDGIGFQNIIANQVHWADSENKALAKTTAWIHYQTAVNEVFGYFAEPEDDTSYKSLGHMVLRRDYEVDENGNITDFTTYIDPEKYNKIFAGNQLTDQNFWMQIGFDVKSRRVMAAYEIPNL